MKRNDTKSKSISFNTALIIVVAVHVLGFFAITQISSYRAKIARANRNAELLSRASLNESLKEQKWPTSKTTPVTLAVARPTPNKKLAADVARKTTPVTLAVARPTPNKKLAADDARKTTQRQILPETLAKLVMENEKELLKLIEIKHSLSSNKRKTSSRSEDFFVHGQQIEISMPKLLKPSFSNARENILSSKIVSSRNVIY
jgi:Tfp pilus assembly protein PilE